jgi:hypothetical protein
MKYRKPVNIDPLTERDRSGGRPRVPGRIGIKVDSHELVLITVPRLIIKNWRRTAWRRCTEEESDANAGKNLVLCSDDQ